MDTKSNFSLSGLKVPKTSKSNQFGTPCTFEEK